MTIHVKLNSRKSVTTQKFRNMRRLIIIKDGIKVSDISWNDNIVFVNGEAKYKHEI